MSTPIPLIEARGTHREVGRQIGEAARDLVAKGLATYQERFLVLAGFSYEEALERCRGYLRPAEDYVPQAVEQLRGLAEGANASFDDLLAFNCSEEFTCAADHVWPRGASPGAASGRHVRPAPEHCTSVAFV